MGQATKSNFNLNEQVNERGKYAIKVSIFQKERVFYIEKVKTVI